MCVSICNSMCIYIYVDTCMYVYLCEHLQKDICAYIKSSEIYVVYLYTVSTTTRVGLEHTRYLHPTYPGREI